MAFRDPKEEFRDKRDPTATSSKDETNFHADLQQKGSPLITRPPIKDHITDSRLRRQQFTEARSSSVLSAPTLKEEVVEEEEEEQRECTRIIESYSNSANDRKMSRSNTISFGEGEVNSAEQKVAEKLAELRLRRSTMESTGEEGSTDPDLMEHKSLPQRHSVPPLVHGFHCCDWVPHKSLVNDERLLSKVAYSHLLSYFLTHTAFEGGLLTRTCHRAVPEGSGPVHKVDQLSRDPLFVPWPPHHLETLLPTRFGAGTEVVSPDCLRART